MSHEEDLIKYAAQKASRNPFYLGFYLHDYSVGNRISSDEVKAFLGITSETLVRLALCRRPDSNSKHFRNDIEHISKSFAIDPSKLLRIVREAESFAAIQTAAQRNETGVMEGLLAAARDAEYLETDIENKTDDSEQDEESE